MRHALVCPRYIAIGTGAHLPGHGKQHPETRTAADFAGNPDLTVVQLDHLFHQGQA